MAKKKKPKSLPVNSSRMAMSSSQLVEPAPPPLVSVTSRAPVRTQSAEEVFEESLLFSASFRMPILQKGPLYPSLRSITEAASEEKVEELFETNEIMQMQSIVRQREGGATESERSNTADGFARIPRESFSENDDELLAMKRSTMENGYSVPTPVAPFRNSQSNDEAVVVAISDSLHPAELLSDDVQQAQFIAEDHNRSIVMDEVNRGTSFTYSIDDNSRVSPSQIGARSNEMDAQSTDATLIGNTTQIPWDHSGFEEAQVLVEDQVLSDDESCSSDRKPAARSLSLHNDALSPAERSLETRDDLQYLNNSRAFTVSAASLQAPDVASLSAFSHNGHHTATAVVPPISNNTTGVLGALAGSGTAEVVSIEEYAHPADMERASTGAQADLVGEFPSETHGAVESPAEVVQIQGTSTNSQNVGYSADVVGIELDIHPADIEIESSEARADFVGNASSEGRDYTSQLRDSAEVVCIQNRIASTEFEGRLIDICADVVSNDVYATTAGHVENDDSSGRVVSPDAVARRVNTDVAVPVVTDPITASVAEDSVVVRGDVIVEESQQENVTSLSKSDYGSSSETVQAEAVSAPAQDIGADDGLEWLRDDPSSSVPARSSNSSGGGGISQRTTTQLQVVSAFRKGFSPSSLLGPNQNQISSSIARGTHNTMVALFGDSRRSNIRNLGDNEIARLIHPRTLLPATVIYSQPTKMWIATLQTNQKALDSNDAEEASKSLRAFSLPSERQAKCLAQAWTPPRMLPFSEQSTCSTCNSRFAVFRRPCHCRNCGLCICKDCSVTWPSKMVPETYNVKKTSTVSVCKACDWLCNNFRSALLDADMDKIVAIHATGNVNIVCPFGNVKGELFYPVHACVLGGSLEALRWLVDENCCPIKSVRISGKSKDSSSKFTAIVTSRGRSLLSIAMEMNKIDIIRYLVVEKGLSLETDKGITPVMLMRSLELALRFIPQEGKDHGHDEEEAVEAHAEIQASAPFSPDYDETPMCSTPAPMSISTRTDSSVSYTEGSNSLNAIAMNFGAVGEPVVRDEEDNECIICCDARIDCVATPCGHQVCCLECSSHLTRCPVCAAEASFMRVFKP